MLKVYYWSSDYVVVSRLDFEIIFNIVIKNQEFVLKRLARLFALDVFCGLCVSKNSDVSIYNSLVNNSILPDLFRDYDVCFCPKFFVLDFECDVVKKMEDLL